MASDPWESLPVRLPSDHESALRRVLALLRSVDEKPLTFGVVNTDQVQAAIYGTPRGTAR